MKKCTEQNQTRLGRVSYWQSKVPSHTLTSTQNQLAKITPVNFLVNVTQNSLQGANYGTEKLVLDIFISQITLMLPRSLFDFVSNATVVEMP